jgi:hypothetical protein
VGKGSRLAFGLRRIDWVCIDLTHAVPRAEVSGAGHRLPVTRPIPMSAAAELARSGVPVVVRREETPADVTPLARVG